MSRKTVKLSLRYYRIWLRDSKRYQRDNHFPYFPNSLSVGLWSFERRRTVDEVSDSNHLSFLHCLHYMGADMVVCGVSKDVGEDITLLEVPFDRSVADL